MYKPIRTKHHTHKILIAIHNAMSNFEEFKSLRSGCNGICDRVEYLVECIAGQYVVDRRLEYCFVTWEYFSGNLIHPIPLTSDFRQQWEIDPDGRDPTRWVYYNCPLWEGEQEKMRRSLCKHIQKCIREHLKGRNCEFEEMV